MTLFQIVIRINELNLYKYILPFVAPEYGTAMDTKNILYLWSGVCSEYIFVMRVLMLCVGARGEPRSPKWWCVNLGIICSMYSRAVHICTYIYILYLYTCSPLVPTWTQHKSSAPQLRIDSVCVLWRSPDQTRGEALYIYIVRVWCWCVAQRPGQVAKSPTDLCMKTIVYRSVSSEKQIDTCGATHIYI